MMTDPISDMLTRIRNAGTARHAEVALPGSRVLRAVAGVLADEGFLAGVREETRDGRGWLVLGLRYGDRGEPLIDGLRRISRPGRRVYVGARDVHNVRSGLGISVLSTSRGVLSDRAAREAGVGGELLCEVW
jgi:small subunit ribosomal protein S8